MQLDEIAGLTMQPEAERLFAKQVCENLRGTARKTFGRLFLLALVLGSLLLLLFLLFARASGLIKMLIFVPAALVCCMILWAEFRWELTFDGATGWFGFSELFHETLRFHVSEIRDVRTDHIIGRDLRQQDVLRIYLDSVTISVPLRRYLLPTKTARKWFNGGVTDAEKLWQYLDLYRRFLSEPDFGMRSGSTGNGLTPAVAAAIAAQKIQKRRQDEEAAAELSAKRIAAQYPEEPTASAPPSGVDADALFDAVLRQHGKKK